VILKENKMVNEKVENVEIVYTTEIDKEPQMVTINREMTAKEFSKVIAKQLGFLGEMAVFLEDKEEPLLEDDILADHLSKKFAPIHVASAGRITVTVRYQDRSIESAFMPSTTIAKIIEWAIGPTAFQLEGEAGDFQIKHNGTVEPSDRHLGQIAHGDKKLTLDLVFNFKPQGYSREF
jgi:hypothetical protein